MGFARKIAVNWNWHNDIDTVKLGDKERFDKEQIGVNEAFPVTNLIHKDKEQF